MASPQERVAELARAQVGYVSPQGKWNKYAGALDQPDLYNFAKNGYDWCDIFYDWLLVEEFGVELAKAMTNQPTKGCGTGRWDRSERHDRQPRRDWVERCPPRRRPSDLAVAAVCILAIGFLGLCAWAGMALVKPAEKEGTELPTQRVTHGSMCATTIYDGELIRWYVMVDPDYRIQYLANDRGGCCVRLDSDGNVMGVSDEETEEADPYEWE